MDNGENGYFDPNGGGADGNYSGPNGGADGNYSGPNGGANWNNGYGQNGGANGYNGYGQNGPQLDYTPISMWGYFGYAFLFGIPIVGLILAIVWSISATNINLRNYARSQFCWLIIGAIVCAILLMTGMAAALFYSFS